MRFTVNEHVRLPPASAGIDPEISVAILVSALRLLPISTTMAPVMRFCGQKRAGRPDPRISGRRATRYGSPDNSKGCPHMGRWFSGALTQV